MESQRHADSAAVCAPSFGGESQQEEYGGHAPLLLSSKPLNVPIMASSHTHREQREREQQTSAGDITPLYDIKKYTECTHREQYIISIMMILYLWQIYCVHSI